MGWFLFLPLVLPLSAWPLTRLAEQHLHPRRATWLLTIAGAALALSSTICLCLFMIVGTAQLPGNPLPDNWSSPEVRDAVPLDRTAGTAAIPALAAVALACGWTVRRHVRVRRRARDALAGLPATAVAVLPDARPYAYTLPGRRGRIVVSTAMLDSLESRERRALFAHERAHLRGRHHRFLLVTQLAARATPFLRPLRAAVAYSAERWADEEAARVVGDRRLMARAIGKAALVTSPAPAHTLAFGRHHLPGDGGALPAFAAGAGHGPDLRRVQAMLDPVPPAGGWLPPATSRAGLAAWVAAAGTAVSVCSSANAAVALSLILYAAM